MHVSTCSTFAIDILKISPHPSTCIRDHSKPNVDDDGDMIDTFAELDENYLRSGFVPRIDPKGYR